MSSREILSEVKMLIPPLLERFHKGQAGRIAVVGGSEDYTGAPYFAAQAATLLGADMAHVVCEKAAGQVIKTYSPNLMVHPYLRETKNVENGITEEDLEVRLLSLLERLHVVVVGPGLGRDDMMQSLARKMVERAIKSNLHIVFDADGLFMLQHNPKIIFGYKRAILTPNIVEFQRLCKAMRVELPDDFPESADACKQACHDLAQAFGGPTIVSKGRFDYISNGVDALVCDLPGGKKRVGGQGDTLSGTAATFLAWKNAYDHRLWDHDGSLNEGKAMLLAAYGACAVTRYCSHAAYSKYGRAMLASNLQEMIGKGYDSMFGEI
ncbi:Ribokinase-like protein [Dipodascopsis uninucleata]